MYLVASQRTFSPYYSFAIDTSSLTRQNDLQVMKHKIFKLLVGLYVITMLYSLYLNIIVPVDQRSDAGAITQFPLALIPVIGSFIGLSVARSWGGLKSRLGKAITFYSLGVLAWGCGVIGWLIYIYVLGRTEVPYPSPADFVYMLAQVMWYTGSLFIAGVIGAQYAIKTRFGWLKATLASLAAVGLSYILLVTVARQGSLETTGLSMQTFFDFYYPIATALSLTLVSVVYLLSHKYLGGIYKKSIIILFVGFIFQFFGDFTYTWTTTIETYHNGHWADMMFTTAMLTLTWGLLLFDTKRITANAATVKDEVA